MAARQRTPHEIDQDPTFPHGSERGYFRGCLRECCQAAHRRANKRRRLANLQGRALLVSPEPVQAHVLALLALPEVGTANHIGRVSGVTPRTVTDVRNGVWRTLRADTAQALLGTTPAALYAAYGYVPARKSVQQIRSLMRLGWTGRYLNERLGHSSKRPPAFLDLPDGWISRTLAERVDALAQEIGDRKGPSAVTSARARAAGWQVPGAYDDDGHLIPGAARDDTYDQRIAAEEAVEEHGFHVPAAEIARLASVPVEIVREVRAVWHERVTDEVARVGQEESAAAIADRLGVSQRTVTRIRARVAA